ncbi:Exportin-6, partial [Acipenser ruthenus]
ASEEASLRALESLMTEFFHSCTSNERKREIEELLNNFAQQTGAWRYCLYFLSNTRNEYVMMYSLTVFENLINKMWLGLASQDKMEIRSCLPKLLLSEHKSLPYFIRNKLCKVIVDIGRQDWPMFYHDFFTNTLQLIQSPALAPLGLILLKTTSEELACPREDLSVARKEELRKLLLEQVPTVLGLLTGDLLSNLLQGPYYSKLLSQPIPMLNSESEHLCSLALESLAHLFSWIPLSTSITPALLDTIFHFARFGCDVRGGKGKLSSTSVNGSTQLPGGPRLGVLAMTCVNELMSKNCVPLDFEEYLLRMFQQTFFLLQKLTRQNNTHTVKSRLEELDESYVEKFTDFLRLFVSVHLRRIESNSQFPVVEFLALLFKYTFHQPTHEGYFSCLDIWTIFLDYLTTKIKSRLADRDTVLNRYKDALVLLLREVLNRIQFRYNQAQLEELDDETLDDDCVFFPPSIHGKRLRYKDALVLLLREVLNRIQFRYNQAQLEELDDETLDDDQQTEWQRYLRQSLEVVAKIMELLPSHAFSTLFPVLQENLDVYLGLQQFIVTSSTARRLNITAENDCRRLHCSLRDLSSLLQAVGRLAEYFFGDVFAARFNDALTVVERLVEVTCYGSQISLYDLETAVPSVLKPDLIDVHAQSLAALQAYSHWLAQFYSEVQRQNQERFVSLITSAMDATTSLISSKVPEKLLLSACHLLVSISTTVRPVFLVTVPAVQNLFNLITDSSARRLPPEAQVLVCRALSNMLLLPWPNLPENEQQWHTRSTNHANLLSALTRHYRLLRGSASLQPRRVGLEDMKAIVHQTLRVLKDVVDSISGESTKSRQICYQSLQESVQVSLALFPVFIHQPDVTDEMLSFFLTLLQGLRVQMGVPFTEQIIQTFLNMFTREQLAESILHEGSAGCRVVEKFLKILQVVVQEPGQAFKPFLPSIISLCMEQVYPIVAERPSPDVKAELFELLNQVLHHNWRYFFKSSVLASVQRGVSEEPMENEAQFIAIMQAFGQSFLQPDIHIFKQNLAYLESLNSKQKLYHKKLFRTTMLFHFLNVLLQVLVHKSHDLLQDDIALAVYNMASVDFDGFYSAFLPEFLNSCQGVDSNQRTVLGRNFKMDRRFQVSERTLIAVKLDGVQWRLVGQIDQRFDQRGFKLVGMKLLQARKDILSQHYHNLHKKPFYPNLLRCMSSGPAIAMHSVRLTLAMAEQQPPQDVDADECLSSYTYIYSPDLLKDKVAFITGGGSGIGFRIAEVLMRHGCDTVIGSRNQERLAEAAKKLTTATGRHCLPLSLDVRQPQTITAAVEETLREFGRIDILINNAAGNFLCPASALSFNAFKTVMEIDTMGTFNTSKVVYEKWLKDHGGAIVNISATLSYRGQALQVHAGSAKAAIDAMTKHLAVEWGPNNIRVNSLAPGPISGTEGYRRLGGLSAEAGGHFHTIPLQRAGNKTEIAHSVLYLASSAASYVTGACLVVDGGSWLTSANSLPALLGIASQSAKL